MDLDTDATESKGGLGLVRSRRSADWASCSSSSSRTREGIEFKFLFWGFTWPLWLYTIIVAVFGAIVWFGLGVMRRRRRRKARRDAR